MKPLVVLALALGIAAAPRNAGADAAPKALELRPKAALALAMTVTTTTTTAHTYAPFVLPMTGEPELDLLPRRDDRQEASRSSCSGERSLCYDPGSGRIIYKPARNFMPDIPGLQRENISVKRDRIVLRYSF
jgi:hypothetical protein